MVFEISQSAPDWRQREIVAILEHVLDGLLDFIHATVGWVGWMDAEGRLQFPARRGSFSESWLTLQQGQGVVWGFEVREGPTLLNDLPSLPDLGEPPLVNLLSVPLVQPGNLRGQIVLANKPQGFTSHDAAVLQGVAHLLARCLSRTVLDRPAEPEIPVSVLWLVFDRLDHGVLAVDNNGKLLYANSTWQHWTGFAAEELLAKVAPFPFWVSHRELLSSGSQRAALPHWARSQTVAEHRGDRRSTEDSKCPVRTLGTFPFRRRNNEVFWCEVETIEEAIEGCRCTIAFLRQSTGVFAMRKRDVSAPALELAENLPFSVVLTDNRGRIIWANSSFQQSLAGRQGQRGVWSSMQGLMLRDCFAISSAAALERLLHDPTLSENGRMGRLILQRMHPAGGFSHSVAYWLALTLADGPGFLFALPEDWEAIALPDSLEVGRYPLAGRLSLEGLSLLFQPGRPFESWDREWAELTGLTEDDLAGVPSEVALDWLFPNQRDRDFVADLLYQPARRGAQAVLDLLGHRATRRMLCTFLPVRTGQGECWLLLVGEPEAALGDLTQTPRYVRQFARGLSYLLNHYLTVPIGLAEMALEREDLPTEVTGWFSQILESCHRSGQLLAALHDLSVGTCGDTVLASLADLVREFLDERLGQKEERTCELAVEVRDAAAKVRVNRRMIKVVLNHLFTNAEQALLNSPRRLITVRVFADSKSVTCEIEDTGEGLGTIDWTVALTPFYSTKGPFARDPAHAALEATGLGLTVSRHLLALHGGRLELHSNEDGGATAAIILPRADAVAVEPTKLTAEVPGESGNPNRAGKN